METLTWNNDVKIFYITAETFPEGITAAHEKLHSLIPFSDDRQFFSVSRPENGQIVYRAGTAQLYDGEAEKFNCESLVLEKGRYASLTVPNYTADLTSIEKAFQRLLAEPNLDPQGYCVEWYISEQDVRCMIRLDE